ncbi:hypothetical protein CN238_07420 [Sinorhizobium meliloti]|nr:hypothetical protein CN238_07420 [Sinorhizobium meliloti]RVH33683.1 hypothetical protein CN214_07570 [Sinorhizobium meliloti]RVH36914.1 hypothetical protein CN211_09275 [Sinorhizobium meliloti]
MPAISPTRGETICGMFHASAEASTCRSVQHETDGKLHIFSPLVGEMAGRPEGAVPAPGQMFPMQRYFISR